jgi:hypothetical protein
MEQIVGMLQSEDFTNRLNSLSNLAQTAAFNSLLLQDSVNQLLKQKKTEGFQDYKFSPVGYERLGLPVQLKALTETQVNYVETIRKCYGLIESFRTLPNIQNIDVFGRVYSNQISLYDTLNQKKKDLENEGNENSKTRTEFDANNKKKKKDEESQGNEPKKPQEKKPEKPSKSDKSKSMLGFF